MSHLVSLKLPGQPPVKWLRVDLLPDSHGVEQDIGGLVVHPLGCALEVTRRNHTQERLTGAQRHLVREGRRKPLQSMNELRTSDLRGFAVSAEVASLLKQE